MLVKTLQYTLKLQIMSYGRLISLRVLGLAYFSPLAVPNLGMDGNG